MTHQTTLQIDPPPADVGHTALPARRLAWPPAGADAEQRRRYEWLVTNGLGGYATGTVSGAITRRYHGLLIAALPAPLGRVLLLNQLAERIRLADRTSAWLSVYRQDHKPAQAEGSPSLVEFRLEAGIPVWRFAVHGVVIERRIVMPYWQNTVHVTYRMLEGNAPVRLTLRPSLDFRPHEAPVGSSGTQAYVLTARDRRIEIAGDAAFPPLRLAMHAPAAASFTVDDQAMRDVRYLLEESRGYDSSGSLWSPGYFRVELEPGRDVTLLASCESWETLAAINPAAALETERARQSQLLADAVPPARTGVNAELVRAADQFVIAPVARPEDQARASAGGSRVRTVIAGYHWFTDWGRDTMISLEGLTLVTGRHAEARQILEMFAHHERRGLIPNLFPEGEREGLYHTADATLWFFHALSRYEAHSGDTTLVDALLATLEHIVECHVQGTDFGIGVAPDGLLTQGADGYQLTWMDAKVDDWVVTPRRGKAVEINALWYNALRLLEGWLRQRGRDARAAEVETLAQSTREAFNARFWNADRGFLFDVVDGEHGDDASCRPNQILAVSLPHPVLDRARWRPVLDVVTSRLLTPVGLRSLAPGEPDYKPRYFGNLRARDAAYHQGTVWTWLIGPFVDAWIACRPDEVPPLVDMLTSVGRQLDDACIGSLSEIFDAEPPFTPRGCIAQAWSVAELLRANVALAARVTKEA